MLGLGTKARMLKTYLSNYLSLKAQWKMVAGVIGLISVGILHECNVKVVHQDPETD
jgi:hypothetical protein